ncbi:unnamed protein product [Protopolystoma xenopodis]|uniref:Uncharacterized protein n=1 Tax=Protopolystoma xenopodis TaxID=117903 RepID=A0A448XDH0_9PLAT|nr:unnamed protein product [Protopolystoma xenopodis]
MAPEGSDIWTIRYQNNQKVFVNQKTGAEVCPSSSLATHPNLCPGISPGLTPPTATTASQSARSGQGITAIPTDTVGRTEGSDMETTESEDEEAEEYGAEQSTEDDQHSTEEEEVEEGEEESFDTVPDFTAGDSDRIFRRPEAVLTTTPSQNLLKMHECKQVEDADKETKGSFKSARSRIRFCAVKDDSGSD